MGSAELERVHVQSLTDGAERTSLPLRTHGKDAFLLPVKSEKHPMRTAESVTLYRSAY